MVKDNSALKSKLLHFLRYGKEKAVKKKVLTQLCNVNERQMRLVIRELIDDGYPICGSPNKPYGYYIAETPEEIKGEMKLIRNSYGMELLRRYSALRKCLHKMHVEHELVDNQYRMI